MGVRDEGWRNVVVHGMHRHIELRGKRLLTRQLMYLHQITTRGSGMESDRLQPGVAEASVVGRGRGGPLGGLLLGIRNLEP